jgi:DNA repair photolyase
MERKALIQEANNGVSALMMNHEPELPDHLEVEQIVLAKGSLATPARETFARRICCLFPSAEVRTEPDTPGSRVQVPGRSVVARLKQGKRILVLDELKNSVRSSADEPSSQDYWSFSTHTNCSYGCRYCYLDAARTVWFSPTIRIHVNLEEIIQEIDRVAYSQGRITAFCLGRLQDALALDPLTGYSKTLVRFFSNHRFARQILATKSDSVDRLLELKHGGKTILCWSLIPPEIADSLEVHVPSVESRIKAMKRCAEKGYPVRVRIQPVFPKEEWRGAYVAFAKDLVSELPLDRIGFGGAYTNGRVKYLMKRRLPEQYRAFSGPCKSNLEEDLYSRAWCERHYRDLVNAAVSVRPGIAVGPCHML